jgi:hypothetical protein
MEKNQATNQLSVQEMESIIGGTEPTGLIGKLAYYVGAAARSIIEFNIMAMEYQTSLPANLKK